MLKPCAKKHEPVFLGFSPPTMVTRSHQPSDHPSQIFAPIMIKNGGFLPNSVPMLKQENGKELVPFVKATPVEQPQVQQPPAAKAPTETRKPSQRISDNVTRSGKVFKKEKIDDEVSEEENLSQDVALQSDQLRQDLNSDESEGPLDLSQPRIKSKKAVVVKAITPGKTVLLLALWIYLHCCRL